MRKGISKKVVILWILALFVFSLTVLPEAFALEGLRKIADNVYAYADIKGGSPANSFGANAGIVVGKDNILVIDTLISAKEAKRFIKDIRAISDKPIKYVVNTHSHLDHTFGNSEFEKLGAVIISHANCKKNMEKNAEGTLKNIKAFGLTEKDMEGTKIAYPALTFQDRIEIDLGGQKVELSYAGASHTDDSILVYVHDKQVLFTGDILFTEYHPFIADGSVGEWINVLDYIRTLDFKKVIPGHGPISGRHDLLEMKEYLVSFDKKATELSSKSKDADKIAGEIMKELPERPEGQGLIKSNIQMKYLKGAK